MCNHVSIRQGTWSLISGSYILFLKYASWSGTSYSRIHFLPFTRDGRGYAQNTPFNQSLEPPHMLEKPTSAYGSRIFVLLFTPVEG